MSQTTLVILLSAAALISAALSFLAWARLARPPKRARSAEADGEAVAGTGGTAELTDEETNDTGEDPDDRDTAT